MIRKILRILILIVVSIINLTAGGWSLYRVLGTAWFADTLSETLVVYMVFGILVPFVIAMLTGILAYRTAEPFRSLLYIATLPYCAPFLILGCIAIPEAITKPQYSLLYWVLFGIVTALVITGGFKVPFMIMRKLNKDRK